MDKHYAWKLSDHMSGPCASPLYSSIAQCEKGRAIWFAHLQNKLFLSLISKCSSRRRNPTLPPFYSHFALHRGYFSYLRRINSPTRSTSRVSQIYHFLWGEEKSEGERRATSDTTHNGERISKSEENGSGLTSPLQPFTLRCIRHRFSSAYRSFIRCYRYQFYPRHLCRMRTHS